MTSPLGSSPSDNPDYQWIQVDSSLNRDDVLQYFVNINQAGPLYGSRVYGRTSGSFSDHIHLYTLAGVDTNYNLDPVSGEVSPNGNLFGVVASVGAQIASFLVPGFGQVASTVAGDVNALTHQNPAPAPSYLPPSGQTTPTQQNGTMGGGLAILGEGNTTLLILFLAVVVLLRR